MFFRSILAALILSSISSASFAQVPPDLLIRAEQGDAQSQYEVGLYYDGQNNTEAMKWYKLASDQGFVHVQMELADRYRNGGEGLPQNSDEAMKWYRLAAQQGNYVAMEHLSIMYQGLININGNIEDFYGMGGFRTEDYVKAYAWAKMSLLEESYSSRRRRLNEISRLMTPEQLSEAHGYVQGCEDNNYKGCD